MNKRGLLLIDYLSEAPCKLRLLLSDESALIFNKPPIGLNSIELISLLGQLADKNLIYLSFNDQSVSLRPTSEKIDEEAKDYLLGLTKEGGEIWEQAMQPDWSMYIGISIQYDKYGNEAATVEAMHASTLQNVLKLFPNDIAQHVDIKKLQPWKTLYWKTLDAGHSITVRYPEGLVPDILYCKIAQKWKKDWMELDSTS